MSDWESQGVLITGGLGCVGSTLAHRLVANGADVTLLDARLPHLGSNPANVEGIRDEVTVVEADVREESVVASHVTDADVVYHCAAQNDRTYARANPQTDVAINCTGTVNVLEAAKSCDPAPRVVYTSSMAVYGRGVDGRVDESTPVQPTDIYGTNKVASEGYCRTYRTADDVPTTVCRLANVYGPRASTDKSFAVTGNFIAAAIRDEVLTVFEPGTMQRDLVHVDDVAAALDRAGRDDRAIGETYVVGSGVPTTIGDIARTAVEVTGTGTVELVPWPEDWKKIKRGDSYTDPSKIRTHLDWEPTVDLEAGVADAVEFYRDHSEAYL
ncbi:MAG: NAD(P)-dependent oxidoreductase [Haloarculaceae archaeon]